MNVLIVEDDIAFSQTLARRLGHKGYETQIENQYGQVLLTARQCQPDAILLDMNLGEGSGLQVIEPLRALLPETKIILLTGFASIATAVKAIRLGADDYLSKPVDLQTLLFALEGEQEVVNSDDFVPLSTERLEWEHIQQVLSVNDGNVSATARQLGMHRRTLQRKLQKKPVQS